MDRRHFLALGATATIAGCLGGRDGSGSSGEGTGSGGGTDTGTAEPTETTAASETLDTHPAARDLASQPMLGPDPTEAAGVVVAFEDPSCPRCKDFEDETVPQIRSNLVEPGDVTLVFRGYPVIFEWGQPAVRALEAAYDADPAAHWTLKDHYYAVQTEYRNADDAAAVYDMTETFLAENTAVDATAVIDRARNGDFDGAVQTDLDAGMDAGAGGTTPHVFFFKDGVYQTKAAGVVSYPIVTRILQL